MAEEDDENDGDGATEDTTEETAETEEEVMDEDEIIRRVPGHGGVPPLPGRPETAKVNGVVHANQAS